MRSLRLPLGPEHATLRFTAGRTPAVTRLSFTSGVRPTAAAIDGKALRYASQRTVMRTVIVPYSHGGPDMAPKPPTFGAPRRSRGAPLTRVRPRHGPQAPNVRRAPAQPWRSSNPRAAPTWPPSPQRSSRPGAAVALL